MIKVLIITLLLTFSNPSMANNEDEAYKKASYAAYKQLGLDKVVRKWQDEYVPDVIVKYSPTVNIMVRAVNDKRVEYNWKWEF